MTLYRYYTLEETKEYDLVMDFLDDIVLEGKITYEVDEDDILTIDDLDLDENDIEEIKIFFDEQEVYEFIDREDSYFNNRDVDPFEDRFDDEWD